MTALLLPSKGLGGLELLPCYVCFTVSHCGQQDVDFLSLARVDLENENARCLGAYIGFSPNLSVPFVQLCQASKRQLERGSIWLMVSWVLGVVSWPVCIVIGICSQIASSLYGSQEAERGQGLQQPTSSFMQAPPYKV